MLFKLIVHLVVDYVIISSYKQDIVVDLKTFASKS
jgi:hypothetical protein